MSDAPEAGAEYTCPHCGQPVIVDVTGAEQIWNCPSCGEPFSLAAEGEQPEPEPHRADELDGLRIRQISAKRRGDIRVRSYLVVAAVGCVGAAAQCLFWAWRAGRWDLGRVAFVVAALALLAGAGWFAARASALSRELAKPLLDEPQSPPDFSQLQDGSQMAKDLEQL